MLALVQLPRVKRLEIDNVVFGMGWWSPLDELVPDSFTPLSEVTVATLSTLVHILMSDCVVQYCKLQRYMILVRFPSKILEIYLVRSMIDCEFVMIRGSFGRPFRSNQSRGGIDCK